MTRVLFIFFLFLNFIATAQTATDEDRYYFYVTINDLGNLTFSENGDGTLRLITQNESQEANIYNAFKVYEFEPAFPGSRLDHLKKVYRIVTNRVELLGRLWHNFPEKYTKIDQFYPNEDSFYPNDFGTTSPVTNLGVDQPLYDLDLINAAGAWGITLGSEKVVMGISDAKIDSTNTEFLNRVQYLSYRDIQSGLQCAHGTNVAAIAAASANNAYGRPGICSNCRIVSHGYGNFKFVEELVAAGARVINTSWAVCSMGKYHKEIEDRINEMYEDGILIVAGAGNAKDCNREDDYAPDDYAYPASYEKVISVTGVHSRFSSHLDSTYIDTEGYTGARHLKDRHASDFAIVKSGKVIAKYQKYVMQFNESIDICAPARSYLLGNDLCRNETIYGGATSSTAPYITGVIGLMWSVNYCLDSYETESILKLTSAAIDHLPGNEPFAGKLGSGRVDAFKAVKMARDMKELMGTVHVKGRDFSRFHFKLRNSPYNIQIEDQVFRDSSSVTFSARNSIVLKPGTRLAPDASGYVKLSIDPSVSTAECFPKPIKKYESVYPEAERSSTNRSTRLYNFEVNYSEVDEQILVEVLSATLKKQRGTKFVVKIFTPDNRLLKEEEFSFPENAAIDIDIKDLKFCNVEITFGKRKEFHRIKISP